jgi:3-dehydroquinate dehydratase-2
MKLLVINGPNLNLLGMRDPKWYGSETLDDVQKKMIAHCRNRGVELVFFQSNREGDIIDRIHKGIGGVDGIIINPGGLGCTSLALRDAIDGAAIPTIEVHLSNIFAREEFRQRLLTAGACKGLICGLGSDGYIMALDYFLGAAPPPAV